MHFFYQISGPSAISQTKYICSSYLLPSSLSLMNFFHIKNHLLLEDASFRGNHSHAINFKGHFLLYKGWLHFLESLQYFSFTFSFYIHSVQHHTLFLTEYLTAKEEITPPLLQFLQFSQHTYVLNYIVLLSFLFISWHADTLHLFVSWYFLFGHLPRFHTILFSKNPSSDSWPTDLPST